MRAAGINTLDVVGRSFSPDPRPDLAGRSAFSLIFFGCLWYKTAENCLNLSRIAIFTAQRSLIFDCLAIRMV